ncbi:MAG: hypothetical protein JWP97_4074 [Labilithrix sp.]|nr:hypothetical protein [Labilithrix sp.]
MAFPDEANAPPQSRLGDVLHVRDAQVVLIQDVWVGYNPASPIAARYQLRRSGGGGLSGEGALSTSLAPKPKRVTVAMKAATASAFLEALAGARLVPGPYVAFQDHTDDYPTIEIVLQVPPRDMRNGSGVALLYTQSQGETHAPWAAFVGGCAYVIAGDDVGRALQALERPLKKQELQRMIYGDQRRRRQGSHARAPAISDEEAKARRAAMEVPSHIVKGGQVRADLADEGWVKGKVIGISRARAVATIRLDDNSGKIDAPFEATLPARGPKPPRVRRVRARRIAVRVPG